MYRFSRQIIYCLIFLALLIPAKLVFSAENDTANWYQVEVLIFKNLESSAIGEEQWPHRVDSQYPAEAKQLQTGEEFTSLQEGPPALLDISADTSSAWHLELFSEVLASTLKTLSNDKPPAADPATDQIAEFEVPELIVDDSVSVEATADAAITDHSELTIPSAYRLLPEELHEFSTYAQNMRWSKNYRVLFHQSWRQAIKAKANSHSIIIESDSHIGDYPELQGSIQLSVSRYLHLQTQLWLNMTELPWVEDEPRSTPPPPPNSYDSPWGFVLPINIAAIDTWPEKSSPLIHSPETQAQQHLLNLDRRQREQLENIKTSRYPYAGAVLMNQQRRMRSSEEHYIDHPLFGLIIKITPYEFSAFIDSGLESITKATELAEGSPAKP